MKAAQNGASIRLMHRAIVSDVLGPRLRGVLWVQGCPHGCPGCIAPESWPNRGGRVVSVAVLAEWLLAQVGIEGITISGGEPMQQAVALQQFVARVRGRADLGVICYTGYVLPMRHAGLPGHVLPMTVAQRAFIEEVDLLIDGPYILERHADLLWRGSDNQRLLPLSPRYADLIASASSERDRSAGLLCTLDECGRPQVIGVPPRPGFRGELEQRMREQGVRLQVEQ